MLEMIINEKDLVSSLSAPVTAASLLRPVTVSGRVTANVRTSGITTSNINLVDKEKFGLKGSLGHVNPDLPRESPLGRWRRCGRFIRQP